MFAGIQLRRWLAVSAGLLCGAAAPCFGQFRAVPQPDGEGMPPVIMVVPPSRETLQALNHAREALKQNRTSDAIHLLQRLIELPEDYFIDKSMQRTLKSETLQILAGLSQENRQAYELLQGTAAKALLDEAKAAGSMDRLEEIVRRFPLTEASLEAGELVASAALDCGNVWQAAVQYSQLRRLPLVSAEHGRRLMLREALAWHQAGQTSRAAELLRELTSQQPTFQAEVAGRDVPVFGDVEQAGRWLAQAIPASGSSAESSSADWLSARSSADGSAAVRSTGPIGGPMWQLNPLAALEAELRPTGTDPSQEILTRLMEKAENALKESEELAWPTTMPLVAGDLMIFRTVRDVVALDRRTGELRWRSVLADPDFDQLWSKIVKSGESPELQSEFLSYLRERMFEDRSYGTLSSDGRLVFALEGQEFLSSAMLLNNANNQRFFGPQREEEFEQFHRLVAYELAGGRLAWEIGGHRLEAGGDFAGHFFLGPPLFSDGSLFVLAEVQGEIRLLMLEASPSGVKKLWSQPLAAPTMKITDSPERRRQALMPAISNGLVICPTGVGAVIAVDAASRRLAWAYQYASQDDLAQNAGNMMGGVIRVNPMSIPESSTAGWIDGNPLVADGHVFLTPTDSGELHCLNLTDGAPLWTPIPRDRAVYLAGADHHRAVLVGPDQIDAVQVRDGKPAWKAAVPIPAPTGRGVWMQDRYSLPLSTGEIATVDLIQGRILARSKIPEGRLPGNLAAGSGGLVSLSTRAAMAFRPEPESESLIAQTLAADPQDATGLALRGELRLHRGEFDAGLSDLRAAVAANPQPYVKSVLAAALLEGLRSDFARYRATVSELDTLTDDPQQRNEFLWLAARGLKAAGEPLAAFERMTYLIDQSLDEFSTEGTGSPWQARNDRRLWGHFAALYRQATPADRQKLDAQILARMPQTEGIPDVELVGALRRYLRAFGFHSSATTARQLLAAKLDPESNDLEYVQELSRLAKLPDAAQAAPAAGKLARWFLTRKRFDDVRHGLAALETRFAATECEPGKTGHELAAALREDADFQEHLQQFQLPWPEGEIDNERSDQPQTGSRLSRVQIVDPVPAHYAGWSFETDQQGLMLIARDEHAERRWVLNRTNPAAANAQVFTESQPPLHRIHLHEHLIGWSTGTEFFLAADLEPERLPPRILWQESLLPPGGINQLAALQQAQRNGRRRAIFLYTELPGAGKLVAITDSAVIYHNGRKLIAADPLTGKQLWSRKDLSRSLFEVTADDEAVAVHDRDGELVTDLGNREPSLSLLRTIDGERIQRTDPPLGYVEWIGGSRVLRWELASEPISLELLDVVRGESIWQAKLARPAAIRVWNQSEVFTIEENRRLTVRNLNDGKIRWTQDLALEVDTETLVVQRWHDRYLVILGASTPVQGTARTGFSLDHLPIYGAVAALQCETGELLWQTTINDPATDPTAFDTAQPAGWPVLLFAGQLLVPPPAGVAAPTMRRLTVTFIDKRTGKRQYFAEQPSNVNVYFVDVDPDRNRLTANFINWSLNLHYTGKHRK